MSEQNKLPSFDPKVVAQWQPFLEDANFGAPVKKSDQAWASTCMRTMVSEMLKTPIGEHIFKNKEKSPYEILTEAETYSTPYSAAGTGYTGVDTIAAYGKLIPLVFRRAIPQLIPTVFAGVQPLSGAQGFYVALKARYKGYGNLPVQIPVNQGYILVMASDVSANASFAPDTTTLIASYDNTADGHIRQAGTSADGIIRVREGARLLVEHVAATAAFNNTGAITASNDGSPIAISAAWQGAEALYKQFFKNYGYAGTTPDWDTLGSENTGAMAAKSKEVGEMGIDLEKFSVVTNYKKLKTTFDVAQMEDLRNNMGINMMEECASILTNEMVLQTNREFIDNIRGVATAAGTFDVNTGSDGRWHMEKIRGLLLQMNYQAMNIWEETRVAPGNKALVSKDVAVALESLPDFNLVNTAGSVSLGQAYTGNIGRFELYTDIFATDNFAFIAFKGDNQIQAGYYYMPYIPLEMATARHPDNLWDNIMGVRTRYAWAENPFGGELYFRDLTVSGLSDIGIG